MESGKLLCQTLSGFKTLNYTQYGNINTKYPPVFCAHGYLRNSLDFARMGQALSKEMLFIAPDYFGRGKSPFLDEPEHYHYMQHYTDSVSLMARYGANKYSWIGSSMGGIIGMIVAAQKNTPVQKLVLNDIGPFAKNSALKSAYNFILSAGLQSFATLREAEAYFKQIGGCYHQLTDEQWKFVTQANFVRMRDGRFHMAIDPKLQNSLQAHFEKDLIMWEIWDRIQCPVLVLRGKKSQVLTQETALEMMSRGPKTRVVEVEDAGHTPNIMDMEQISVIEEFLKS